MSNVVEQQVFGMSLAPGAERGREGTLSSGEEFRLRMENQCHQIHEYRLAMLRESGRLLSPDEAALEWIERYAATFDCSSPAF